jgi:hypothetical protein
VTDIAARDDHRARTPRAVWPVDRRRVAAATAATVLVAVAIVAVVSRLPDSLIGGVAAVALGLLVVPLVASPLEWLVRCVYHLPVLRPLRPINTVHTAHHFAYFPTWRYVTSGPARRLSITADGAPDVHRSAWGNARVRLAHFTWYMGIGVIAVWVPAWLATGDTAFLAGVIASSAIVSNLFIVVHDTIHRPGSHPLVEAQPWFAFLDRHHFIHHVDLGANLNFLLPFADWAFGTLRTEMTDDELRRHGTLEQAKARPVGTGERARDAASPAR